MSFIYFKICRLHAENTHLLKNYYVLYRTLDGKSATARKLDTATRISIREFIKLQFHSYIAGRFSGFQKKIMGRCMEMDYRIRYRRIKPDWGGCQECEMRNLRNYYNTLFTRNLPHALTDLLIGQKSKIEDCLQKNNING